MWPSLAWAAAYAARLFLSAAGAILAYFVLGAMLAAGFFFAIDGVQTFVAWTVSP